VTGSLDQLQTLGTKVVIATNNTQSIHENSENHDLLRWKHDVNKKRNKSF